MPPYHATESPQVVPAWSQPSAVLATPPYDPASDPSDPVDPASAPDVADFHGHEQLPHDPSSWAASLIPERT
ncbi:hypothetical protein CRG98_032624 [Punica granatum]|uniref:Uncharacterized protein n=1 Tax=Punica granatum TaxID=22663 RepID=A0A2I0ISM6_PUNGR|nr:hypothetical protein CRG98_032624 [Punica granatum]